MKHFKLFTKLALVGIVVLFAAGCSKVNNEPLPPIANLAVYHVSPDAPKLGFRLNSSNLYSESDSLKFGNFGYYLNAYAGSRELSAYQQTTKKLTATFDLKEGSIYSAWLTGRWSAPEFVLLEDKLTNPAAGKAHIRFVNMSVDAPSLDLVTSTGTSVVSNRAYKENSDFVAIDGNQNYNFVIRENGSTTDKVLLPSVTIQSGRIYTIVAKGFYSGTGLSGDLLVNY